MGILEKNDKNLFVPTEYRIKTENENIYIYIKTENEYIYVFFLRMKNKM